MALDLSENAWGPVVAAKFFDLHHFSPIRCTSGSFSDGNKVAEVAQNDRSWLKVGLGFPSQF
jgi:hypothetical protein